MFREEKRREEKRREEKRREEKRREEKREWTTADCVLGFFSWTNVFHFARLSLFVNGLPF